MPGEINWRMKYQELKSKYMNAVDMAFRLGVEEGLKQGALDSANQQLAQSAAEDQGAGGGDAPGAEDGGKTNNNGAPGTPNQGSAGADKSGAPSVQPNEVEAAPAAPMAESEHPDGSELDQHIATLEGMLKKTEELDADDLKKAVADLKSLQKSYKEKNDLRKSAMAIPRIARAMHKPQFKFGVQAQHNLTSTAKAAVNMQHEIVNHVLQKWEEEEGKAGKDILSTLGIDGLVKRE
jgi:hypothetical protein